MAQFSTNVSVDFSDPGYFYQVTPSSVISANGSEIKLRAPTGDIQSYQGSFYYYGNGDLNWSYSTLNTVVEYSSNGAELGRITGLSIPGYTYYNYSINNDFAGLRNYAFRGNDTFNGSSYNDIISGYSGDDVIYGKNGDDLLAGSYGNDYIDGGAGNDWALFFDSFAKYATNVVGRSIQISSYADGYDLLDSIELLQFTDQSVSIAQLAGRQDPDAVFRFYDANTNAYFYSGSVSESDYLIRNTDNFVYEGIAFDQNRSGSPDTIDVLRFLNTQTGTYFYTGDQREANNVFQNYPHFKYEGIAYQAHNEHVAGTTELFRFLKEDTGTHLYTADANEFQNIVNNYGDNFKYEGIAYFVDIA